MHHLPLETITYLAEIADPTPRGILTRIFSFGLSTLMLLVVLIGGYHIFSKFMSTKGEATTWKGVRDIVVSVLIVEAVLGSILFIANYSADLVPTFTGG